MASPTEPLTIASHEVPVHVITSRPALLRHLRANGFGDGVAPERPRAGEMHTLVPMLWRAFGAGE